MLKHLSLFFLARRCEQANSETRLQRLCGSTAGMGSFGCAQNDRVRVRSAMNDRTDFPVMLSESPCRASYNRLRA